MKRKLLIFALILTTMLGLFGIGLNSVEKSRVKAESQAIEINSEEFKQGFRMYDKGYRSTWTYGSCGISFVGEVRKDIYNQMIADGYTLKCFVINRGKYFDAIKNFTPDHRTARNEAYATAKSCLENGKYVEAFEALEAYANNGTIYGHRLAAGKSYTNATVYRFTNGVKGILETNMNHDFFGIYYFEKAGFERVYATANEEDFSRSMSYMTTYVRSTQNLSDQENANLDYYINKGVSDALTKSGNTMSDVNYQNNLQVEVAEHNYLDTNFNYKIKYSGKDITNKFDPYLNWVSNSDWITLTKNTITTSTVGTGQGTIEIGAVTLKPTITINPIEITLGRVEVAGVVKTDNGYSNLGSSFTVFNNTANKGDIYISNVVENPNKNGYATITVSGNGTNIIGSVDIEHEYTYTIDYDLQGGQTSDNLVREYKVSTPTFNLTENVTKTGYGFTGWTENGNKITQIVKGSYGDKTLVATYNANTYTVKYLPGSGTGTMSDSTFYYDSRANLKANTFTKTGYSFANWTGSDGKTYTDGQQVLNLTAQNGGVITLTANWTINNYNVSFKTSKTGSWNSASSISVPYGTAISVSSNVITIGDTQRRATAGTKTGYIVTFGNITVTDNATSVPAKDITVTANFTETPITYTIVYNANGGTGTTASSEHTYDASKALTTNGFTRTGYAFAGWSTTSGGSKAYDNGASVKNLSSTDGATVNLYAVWTANDYTIKFNANNGAGTMSDLAMKYGTAKNLTANTFTRTGYTFSGWNTVAGGTGTAYADKAEVNNLATSGTFNLYAQWTPITYTVKFDGNNSTTGTMSNQSFTYDVAQNLRANGFERKYTVTYNANNGTVSPTSATATYTFNGWKNGSSSYTDKQSVSNLTSTNGGSVTLTAQWTGGSVTLPTPERTGYTFGGWYTNSNLTGTSYTSSYTATGTTTLYAKWTANTYTIAYAAGGGSGTMSNQTSRAYDTAYQLTANTFTRAYTVTYNHNYTGSTNGSATATYTFNGWKCNTSNGYYGTSSTNIPNKITANSTVISNSAYVKNLTTSGIATLTAQWDGGSVTLPTPSRTGYTFGGWYKETGCTNSAGAGGASYTATGNIILYAKWTANTYTIAYAANGGSGTMSNQTLRVYDTVYQLTAEGFTNKSYKVTYNYNYTGSTNGSTTATCSFAGWTCNADNGYYGASNTTVTNKITKNSTKISDKAYVKNLTTSGTVTLSAQWTNTAITLSTPTRTGYTFGGWYKETGCTTSVGAGGASYTPTANITLYAKWTANGYEVKYNANGGTGTMANSSHKYDTAKNLTANTFTRVGYTFSKWNTKTDGSGTNYSDKAEVKNLATTGTFNLYAQWTPITYTVSYNKNGGTGTTANSTHTYDKAQALTTNGYSRTGYTFAGWKDASGNTYADKASVKNLSSTNGETVTLTAQWTGITYYVKYNANGGSGTMSNTTHTYGTGSALRANAFTRTGYAFSKWNTKADGTGTSYTNGQSVSTLTSTAGGTVTLYAQWTGITYYVKYNANGGSGTMSNTTHTYGTGSALRANAFTRTGYAFLGWSTSSTATSATYTNGQNVSTLTTTSGGTVNLYAIWKANTYTVAYHANGGSGTTASATHTYGVAKTLTANGFERDGYSFLGWSKSNTATSASYTDKQSVTNLATSGTVTLYAIWKINTYTVKFDANGGGTPSSTSKSINHGSTLGTLPTTSRSGYNFEGWYTAKTGGDKVATDTIVDEGNVTLYAHWSGQTVLYIGADNFIKRNYENSTLGSVTDKAYNIISFYTSLATAMGVTSPKFISLTSGSYDIKDLVTSGQSLNTWLTSILKNNVINYIMVQIPRRITPNGKDIATAELTSMKTLYATLHAETSNVFIFSPPGQANPTTYTNTYTSGDYTSSSTKETLTVAQSCQFYSGLAQTWMTNINASNSAYKCRVLDFAKAYETYIAAGTTGDLNLGYLWGISMYMNIYGKNVTATTSNSTFNGSSDAAAKLRAIAKDLFLPVNILYLGAGGYAYDYNMLDFYPELVKKAKGKDTNIINVSNYYYELRDLNTTTSSLYKRLTKALNAYEFDHIIVQISRRLTKSSTDVAAQELAALKAIYPTLHAETSSVFIFSPGGQVNQARFSYDSTLSDYARMTGVYDHTSDTEACTFYSTTATSWKNAVNALSTSYKCKVIDYATAYDKVTARNESKIGYLMSVCIYMGIYGEALPDGAITLTNDFTDAAGVSHTMTTGNATGLHDYAKTAMGIA